MIIRERIRSLLGRRTEGKMDALLKAYTRQGKFSGSVLVAQHSEILFSKGYGLANREDNVPNTPQTVFRIGSMSKSFTAIAVMQLVEGGHLALHQPISKHLPDFPNADRITPHQLLSNTSGIPDYIIMPEYQDIAKRHITPNELTTLFRDKPLQFEPGTDFGYSNSGWVLLGMIAEKITGQEYGDLIRDHIFQPTGMNTSGYEWEQPIIPHRARGYIDTGAGMQHAEWIDETSMYAAGGLYSTTEDLFRWWQALRENHLLHADNLKQMAVPVTGQYGYGWELYSLHQHPVVAHSGGLPGYVSNFVRLPEDDAVIILMSNLGSAAFAHITDSLAAILFNQPYQLPSAFTFVDVDAVLLHDYVGDYKVTYFGRTSILKFSLEGDKLVMNVMGLPKATLNAFSDTRFFARSKGDVEMTFVRDDSGQVNTIDMLWSGHAQTAVRVA